jgi:hypothetical protein
MSVTIGEVQFETVEPPRADQPAPQATPRPTLDPNLLRLALQREADRAMRVWVD